MSYNYENNFVQHLNAIACTAAAAAATATAATAVCVYVCSRA